MNRIDKILKKALLNTKKELLKEESNLDDLFLFKSMVGGTLGIPTESNPTNIDYVNKSETNFSKDFILNEWANYGSVSPKKICEFYKLPNEKMETCLIKGYQTQQNKKRQGGVINFEATHPISKKRSMFKACWKVGDTYDKIYDFKDFVFLGYFSSENGPCKGEMWKLDTGSEKADKFNLPKFMFSADILLDK